MTEEPPGRKNSPRKIVAGSLLALPIGYLMIKGSIPDIRPSHLDHALLYLMPSFFVLAMLIDGWDHLETSRHKVIKSALYLMTAAIVGIFAGQGSRLNENQKLGIIAVGALIVAFSTCFLYFGSLRCREYFADDRILKIAFRASIACWIFSFLQIPLWVVLTGQYPPGKFSSTGAVIAMLFLGLSVSGSGMPWIILYRRHLIETSAILKRK